MLLTLAFGIVFPCQVVTAGNLPTWGGTTTTSPAQVQQPRQPIASQPAVSDSPTRPAVSPAAPLIRPAPGTFERVAPAPGVIIQESGIETAGAQWADWSQLAWDATKTAVNSRWILQASFTNIRINGVNAIGPPRCLQGPDLAPIIRLHLVSNGVPPDVADIFANSIGGAFAAWQNSVTVPGLPWYPSFAAFPGPQAPPTPNVPTPLISLVAARQAELTSGDRLSQRILTQFSNAVPPHAREEILSFSRQAATQFQVWLSSARVQNVQGQGPVPTYAPPYVPTGAVVGGAVIPAPGVVIGNLR